MTVGPLRPGRMRRTSSSRSRGTLDMTYRCPRARITDSSAETRSLMASARSNEPPVVRDAASGATTSRALDWRMVATSCRPLTRSVEPEDTRSTMTSAMPRCGAISAAPETGTSAMSRHAWRKYSAVTRGKLVATRAPCRMSASEWIPLSSVAATARRHWPSSRSASVSSARPDSWIRSHPVIPTSAAPSATNSGMSWARTKIPSKTPPSDAVRARSPRALISSPASANSARMSSARRPLFGRAMRSMKAVCWSWSKKKRPVAMTGRGSCDRGDARRRSPQTRRSPDP